MKSKLMKRTLSALMCVPIAAGFALTSLTAGAAVLPDGYEADYENKPYDSLGILEDQYDLIEPVNNRYPIISPSSEYDRVYPPLFVGTYEEVEDYFRTNGMSDGMPIVPPTKIKAEKFMGYSAYGFYDEVAKVNGRSVKAYQVAANAIMAGCSPEYTPVCIAFTQALEDKAYLDSLRSGKLTPMMYVNGPIAREIAIDNAQGMTTEECNISIGRFMELALINLAGIKRNNAFGNVQPLVFSENDEICLNIGWKPHHVEKGYNLNDSVITATSFAMWGNNITPATDLPDEIMKVMAWDITEKNLGGLGSASVEDNANTRRLIFITESVAKALSAKYKSKADLESALVANARRPLWMRAYAYYYANTGGALSRPFNNVYNELKLDPREDAKSTAAPAWMNGITYSNIDTVATMTKGNTDIIVTGDSSRNKTQVMPGGVSAMRKIEISENWNTLVTGVNYFPIEEFFLTEQATGITPLANITPVLPDGTYRILDPATVSEPLKRSGTVYLNAEDNTLHYYDDSAKSEMAVAVNDAAFITYLNTLGANSSFTIENDKFTSVVLRFSVIAQKLNKNAVALTSEALSGIDLTLHANSSTQGSSINAVGGLAKDNSTVVMSSTVTTYDVNLDGEIIVGNTTNPNFVTISGGTVTVDPSVEAGAAAAIGVQNDDGTYRTMTFVNGGDGTYTITYNTENTLEGTSSAIFLSFIEPEEEVAFEKTGNNDIVAVEKALEAGTYKFTVDRIDSAYVEGESFSDTAYRLPIVKNKQNYCYTLNAQGGIYEFKYEISTKKISVYFAVEEILPDSDFVYSDTEPDTETGSENDTDTDKHSDTSGSDTETIIDSDTHSDTDQKPDPVPDTDTDSGTDSFDPDHIHNWSAPVFTWYGTRKAVAVFTCEVGKVHTLRVNADVTSETVPAACEADGKIVYTATATLDGDVYTDTKTETIDKLGHDYGEPEWTWNGYKTAYAVFTCSNDRTHTDTVNAVITSKTEEPTCEGLGSVVYTAEIDLNGKTYTSTKTELLSAKGHSYKLTSWDWNGYESADAVFTCENDESHVRTVKAQIAGKTNIDGSVLYTASVEFEGKTYTDSRSNKPAGILGDLYGDGTVTSSDALMILRASAGLTALSDEQKLIADVDGDGTVTSSDALEVLRYSAGFSRNKNIGKPIA